MKVLWQQIANTTVTEILCKTDFDGIVLDCEHGYFNNETLVNCIRIIVLNDKIPLVRLKYDERLIQLCIDNGCYDIIISNAKENIMFTYSLGLVENNFWGNNIIECKKINFIAQIESLEGLKNLCSMCNFNYYIIGMYDLSESLGCTGDFECDDFINAIKKFESKVPINKRGIHLVKDIEKNIVEYKDYGFIAYSLDTLFLLDGIKKVESIG